MFDAMLEPLPFLPVYDAMTEMLSHVDYAGLFDDGDGSRVYLFQRGADAVALMYNWKEQGRMISLVTPEPMSLTVLDIMANPSGTEAVPVTEHTIAIGAAPQYVVMPATAAQAVTVNW